MSMAQVRALMKQAGAGFLATTDGRRAEVRPMGAWAWKDGELWMAAGAGSSKVADIEANPGVEMCFMTPDGHHVRIAGPCRISRDNADKGWLYKEMPDLPRYVDGPAEPDWVVLRLSPQRVRVMASSDFSYAEIDPAA